MKICKQKPLNKRRSKRHFQLLEIMVAIFILLICAAPAMRIYVTMFKEQQLVIRENERDHIARVLHARITEKLYKRQIPLQDLAQGKKLSIDDPDLQKRLKELSYEGAYILGIDKRSPKDESKPATKYLLRLFIILKDLTPQPASQTNSKKAENQDSRETVYDYYMYVSAKKDKQKNSGEEDVPNVNPGNENKGAKPNQANIGTGKNK